MDAARTMQTGVARTWASCHTPIGRETDEGSPIEPHAGLRKVIAWTAFVLAVAAEVATLLLYQRAGFRSVAIFVGGPAAIFLAAVVAVVFAALGLVLVLRLPRHPVGWILLLLGVDMAVPYNLAGAYASHALSKRAPALPAPDLVAWLGTLVSGASGTLLLLLLLLVFPTGQLSSPRSRLALGVALAGTTLFTLGLALEPGPLFTYPVIDNPFGIPGPLGIGAMMFARLGIALMIAAWLAALALMVRRFRVATEREQQQLKWFALGGGLLVAAIAAFAVVLTLNPTSPTGEVLLLLAYASSTLIPISVTIAIIRHRLYDIDELISATVVYGALTAILAGIYSASIRLFNDLFVALTGERSDAALVITTLILATSFTPIKGWLERAVKSRYSPEPASSTPQSAEEAALDDRIRRVVRDELARRG
jgi:hypothetical protein